MASSSSEDAIAERRPRQRSACVACNKAKRKCSRQSPACRRCRILKTRCSYLVQVVQSAIQSVDHALLTPDEINGALDDGSRNGEKLGLDLDPPWFLKPSYWVTHHPGSVDDVPGSERISFPMSGMAQFVADLRTWLDQWVQNNACPFLHPRLYGAQLPEPLQYAFGAWTTYRAASTPTSRTIALEMASNWAQKLLREQAIVESLGAGTAPLESQDHLARTQALLVLVVVCVFDGDIRASAQAETLLSSLVDWADELMSHSAAEVASYAAEQPPVFHGVLNEPQIKYLRSCGTATGTWRAWILSESIRRTWIVSVLTRSAFYIMRQGFASCPGIISFTGREGPWDATWPQGWLESLGRSSGAPVTVCLGSLDQLLDTAKPSEVDELTKTLLAYGRGSEAVGDWLASEMQ